jgi:hypothetical protein
MTKSHANRGKVAEKATEKVLDDLNSRFMTFAYERLPDARSAGGRLKAVICDYLVWWKEMVNNLPYGHSILLEVKETEHEYRLPKDKVSQYPRLKKFENAGATALVLVFHSKIDKWRVMTLRQLDHVAGDASWDLRNIETFNSASDALKSSGVFPR